MRVLQKRKSILYRTRLHRIRRSDHDLEATALHVLDWFLASLVFRSINHENRILSEVPVFLSEYCRQLWDEETENLRICVDLVERAVELSTGTDCHLQRCPRTDLTLGAGLNLTTHAPLSPRKVHVANPGLIQVDNPHTFRNFAEHELAELRAKDQTAVRVTEERNFF